MLRPFDPSVPFVLDRKTWVTFRGVPYDAAKVVDVLDGFVKSITIECTHISEAFYVSLWNLRQRGDDDIFLCAVVTNDVTQRHNIDIITKDMDPFILQDKLIDMFSQRN